VVRDTFIPRIRKAIDETNFERITQPVTDFIRGNPIVSGVVLGSGAALSTLATASIVKRVVSRKKRKKTKKRPTAKRKRKVTGKRRKRSRKRSKADLRKLRLRNLAKARRVRKRGGRRKIIRGPGLGTREIRHSGKSTKGKFKVVSFRDKRTGKLVRFKAKK